jgi:NAD(P)-dependent dehydrogenase (short-subunit alcohol dehydrogenase family)
LQVGRADGKVAIVTGASRGIGVEIAKLMAAEGAKVVCAARTMHEGEHRFEGSLESTTSQIRAAGGTATPVAVNLAEPADCERLVQEARAAYGPVDILVNNAALTYFYPVRDFPLGRWLRSWAINFQAPFYLSQLVLQDMVPRRSGAIVNISSVAAIGPGRGPYESASPFAEGGPLGGSSCYGAEKAAIERFTQGLAGEVYNHGISVTCVAPSLVVPTPGTLHHKLVRSLDDPAGEPPALIAQAVLLLATEPLDKVSGRVVYSQPFLHEYGLVDKPRGIGAEAPGTGYSQMGSGPRLI